MQQRQLRLGDILDDYCPRERRVTNHAVVAMIGDDVKQTRCTTCDAEHEYKHAKVPRQRRKTETPAALYAQVLASAPEARRARAGAPAERRPAPATPTHDDGRVERRSRRRRRAVGRATADDVEPTPARRADDDGEPTTTTATRDEEEGPVHRPLIRASLPRHRRAAAADAADSRIHHPPAGAAVQNRFRPRHQRGAGGGGGQQFQGNRSRQRQRARAARRAAACARQRRPSAAGRDAAAPASARRNGSGPQAVEVS